MLRSGCPELEVINIAYNNCSVTDVGFSQLQSPAEHENATLERLNSKWLGSCSLSLRRDNQGEACGGITSKPAAVNFFGETRHSRYELVPFFLYQSVIKCLEFVLLVNISYNMKFKREFFTFSNDSTAINMLAKTWSWNLFSVYPMQITVCLLLEKVTPTFIL